MFGKRKWNVHFEVRVLLLKWPEVRGVELEVQDNLLEVGQNGDCAWANVVRLNFGLPKERGQGKRGCVLPGLLQPHASITVKTRENTND